MTSWVYVFSKFTPEALLFEALTICLICACYAAYWILRKRKLGAVEEMLPSSVVQIYLNELIGDAEQMRAQLFGLLSGAGIQMSQHPGIPQQFIGAIPGQLHGNGATPAAAPSSDPAVAQKMMSLEAQMASQTKAIESIMLEKSRLEKELAEAKLSGAAGPAAPGKAGASGNNAELEEKVKDLEARLNEYSVIEDDLANLKRLQQENAQLKSTLAGKGQTLPVAAAAEVQADEPPTADIPAAEPEVAAAAPQDTAGEEPTALDGADAALAEFEATANLGAPETPEKAQDSPAELNGDEALAAALANEGANPPVSSAEVPELASSFEALVDQVEESLQPTQKAEPKPAAAAAVPVASQQSTSPAQPASMDKSDADLVAEFEKMLSG